MRKLIHIVLLLFILTGCEGIFAQSPQGKEIGFGIILGDPTGGTLKFWTEKENAIVIDLGTSYFGKPRIGVDYLWHFEPFNTDIANLYAGVGGAIGFGEGNGFWFKDKFHRTGNEIGFGARGVFGVNVLPRHTPLEAFFEIGVLLGFIPDFGSAADAAIGIRFYP